MADLRQRVGRNLIAHRRALGLGQDAFAAELGMHRTYVSAIERGERNLTLRSVERLADRAGLEVLDLFKPIDD